MSKLVGIQVWKAELALSDFVWHMISTSSKLDGIISVELGAGTGLSSLLLSSELSISFALLYFGSYPVNVARS